MEGVIIAGGGPAGSVAGLLLARAGFAVELFEQHVFPRDKVCGECLSGVGTDVLSRTGILPLLELCGPAHLTRSLLHPMDGPTIELALPRQSLGISRLKMDAVLLDAARDAGVIVHQPARCEFMTQSSRAGAGDTGEDTPRLRWRDLRTNTRHETSADWIILADGKGALLSNRPAATGDIGIKTHFTNIQGPRDAIELFAGHGHYGGLAAVESDRWNAAFSVPAGLVRHHGGDLQKVFDQIAQGNAMLLKRLTGACRVGPWLAAPVPRFPVSKNRLSRIIPIGNAVAALEPVGGEGMGLALRSAELAAHAIIATQMTGDDSSVRNLPNEFKKLWQIRRMTCRGIALIFSSEHLADALAPLMAANSNLTEAIMRMAGKGDGKKN